MKILIPISLLVLLASCSSSGDKKTPSKKPSEVTKTDFTFEKPLNKNDVRDYYVPASGALNPALEDETLDRYSADELDKLADEKDPLVILAVRCGKRDFNKAFALIDQMFQKYQKIPSYWNLVGNCHILNGSPRKALLFYNKSLEVGPNYVPALNNIGVLYSWQNDDQKAFLAFEKANKTSAFSKTPRYNLARLYLKYGVVDKALPLFNGILSSSPNDVQVLNSIASAHVISGNYKDALSFYNRIPKKLHESAAIGLNLSLTYFHLNMKKEALDLFNDIKRPEGVELREYYSIVASKVGAKK